MSDSSESQMPIFQVVIVLLGVVLIGGWGVLASSYVGAHNTSITEMTDEEREAVQAPDYVPRRSRQMAAFGLIASIGTFIKNTTEQLPNFPQVMSWHFQNRIWLPITIAGVGLCVLIGGGILKQVDSQLHAQPRKRKRN